MLCRYNRSRTRSYRWYHRVTSPLDTIDTVCAQRCTHHSLLIIPSHLPTPTTDSPPPEEKLPRPSSLRHFYLFRCVLIYRTYSTQLFLLRKLMRIFRVTNKIIMLVSARARTRSGRPYLNIFKKRQSYLRTYVSTFSCFTA